MLSTTIHKVLYYSLKGFLMNILLIVIAIVIILIVVKFLYGLIIYTGIEKEIQLAMQLSIEEFEKTGIKKTFTLKHNISKYRTYLTKQPSLQDFGLTGFAFENQGYQFNFIYMHNKTTISISELTSIDNENISEVHARMVIDAYGKLLEDTSIKPSLDGSFDEELLPFPKEIITQAIKKLLTIETDEKNIKLLQGGLVMLDDYITS